MNKLKTLGFVLIAVLMALVTISSAMAIGYYQRGYGGYSSSYNNWGSYDGFYTSNYGGWSYNNYGSQYYPHYSYKHYYPSRSSYSYYSPYSRGYSYSTYSRPYYKPTYYSYPSYDYRYGNLPQSTHTLKTSGTVYKTTEKGGYTRTVYQP